MAGAVRELGIQKAALQSDHDSVSSIVCVQFGKDTL
jgi:hypothetical protein